MKICWDNLENIRLNKNGDFIDISSRNGNILYYYDSCLVCEDPFLAFKLNNTGCGYRELATLETCK